MAQSASARLSPYGMVFLTEACDKSCPHCFNTWDPHMNASEVKLDCDAVLALLESGMARGLERVALTGGEPLLHQWAVRLVADLDELGLYTVLFTSGTHLDRMSALLAWAGLDELRFSFNEFPYAVDQDTFDKLWRVFEERLEPALPWFRDRIMVNAIASRRSLPLVGVLRSRLECLGIERVKVQPLFVSHDNPWYERLTLHKVTSSEWDAHEHAIDVAGAYGQADYLALFRAFYENGRAPERCGAAPMLVVGADGRVHPCLNRFDLSVGNIATSDPEDIIDAVASHTELRFAACFREECLCLFRTQELS